MLHGCSLLFIFRGSLDGDHPRAAMLIDAMWRCDVDVVYWSDGCGDVRNRTYRDSIWIIYSRKYNIYKILLKYYIYKHNVVDVDVVDCCYVFLNSPMGMESRLVGSYILFLRRPSTCLLLYYYLCTIIYYCPYTFVIYVYALPSLREKYAKYLY